jgi:hypothetical protein
MDWFVTNHDALEGAGGLAALLSLIAIVVGGGFGLFRFLRDREQALIQAARSLYYEYCRLSIDNPEYFLEYWNRKSLTQVDRQRYVRFVCFMINGIEDICSADRDPAWHKALREDFRPHVDFLRSDDFRKLRPYFFPQTCDIIDDVIAEERGAANA